MQEEDAVHRCMPHLSTCAHTGTEEGGVGREPEDVTCSDETAVPQQLLATVSGRRVE